MSETDQRIVLSQLRKLKREGEAMLHDRPLDEIAHAHWSDRVDRWLARAFPQSRLPSPSDLVDSPIPDLLDPSYEPPEPIDAAMSRTDLGRELCQKQLAVIASRIELVELKIEQDQQ